MKLLIGKSLCLDEKSIKNDLSIMKNMILNSESCSSKGNNIVNGNLEINHLNENNSKNYGDNNIIGVIEWNSSFHLKEK